MRREISNEFPDEGPQPRTQGPRVRLEGPLLETSNFMWDLFTLQSSQTDLHL